MNAAPILSPTTFAELWHLGYGPRLLPIVPPNAEVSERSTLYKRAGTPKDGRGKTPGVRGKDGKWHSWDWQNHETLLADLTRWTTMEAGIGCRMGNGLAAIDADTLDKVLAALIQQSCINHFSILPTRIGNWPKALYLIRVSGPFPYKRVDFGNKERVEVLTEGKQAVFAGVHPKTGAPYSWPFPLVPFDQLPIVTPEQLTAFLYELSTILPAAKPVITEGAGNEVSQASLRGELGAVRKAVAALPNTTEAFPTRETWYMVGYAIKGALQDYPEEAFELFADWSSRWMENGEPASPGNDPAYVEAEWARFKGPFKVGANKLYELAEQHAPEAFKKVDVFFDEIPEPAESLFGHEPATNNSQGQISYAIDPSPYTFPAAPSIPRREWLYGDHYVRGFVSATVAPGGLGKSSLTIVEALAMATGKPLLGVKSRGQFRVWLWNGEDPRDELDRRISAAMQHYGLTPDDVGDRLLVDSGMEQEIVLAKEARDGALIVEPVAGALASALQRKQIDIFVADPFVSSHKVSENNNGAIDLVVKRWAKIAYVTRASIELVHHVRKTNGEEVTVEDARGASALVNGTRAARALTRMTAKEGQSLGVAEPWRYFRSGGVAKSNMAPPSGLPADRAEWFTLKSEQLGNGQGHGVEALMTGDAVGVVTRAALTTMAAAHDPGEVEKALRLIGSGNWRADPRAGDAWVGHAVAQAFGLDASDSGDKATIQGMLKQWRRELRIRDEAGKDASRHIRQFVRVVPSIEAPRTCPDGDGVFA
jgi:hypothetical protein